MISIAECNGVNLIPRGFIMGMEEWNAGKLRTIGEKPI
jgi:hypothetical protein